MNLFKSIPNGQKKKPCPQNQNACCHCNFPRTSYVPNSSTVDEEVVQTRKLKQHHFTPAFLRSVWQKYHQPPATLSDMSEEETAIWVERLARFKGWTEARAYAQSFKINGVTGYVLPYLSVKTLRSELGILKFGHRLEIIAAIENSELTLINPSIVSIRPDAFFKLGKNFCESQCQLAKNWENTNLNEREVKKWLAGIPRKASRLLKTKENDSISSGGTSSEKSSTCDQDPQKMWISEGCEIWRPKDDMIFRSKINSVDTRSVKKNTICKSKSSSIPIKLPSAISGLDGNKEVDDLTMEFVRGGEERLNTIFSNAKSSVVTSCGCNPQKKCWGSLAAEEVVREAYKN